MTPNPGSEKTVRARIVMLVDNGVEGDSRVQKQAQSTAAQGFDVVLIGRGPRRRRWKIGDARVRLLKWPDAMRKRPHQERPAWLRRPLAYRTTAVGEFRAAYVSGRCSDLAAQLSAANAEGKTVSAATRKGQLLATKVERRWVNLRAREARKVRRARRDLSAPIDRLTTEMWAFTLGKRAWRRLDPQLLEFEAVYAPVIDSLRPDIIHANDFRMLGVAARAVLRARRQGRDVKLVWDAHEYLPGIRPWSPNPRWHRAQILHEREYSRFADAVVTVTEPLADWLVESHGLTSRPAVVLNAPLTAELPDFGPDVSIRKDCGITDDDVPLLVYSGAAAPQRGLDTMIDAMVDLPEVHTALVVKWPPNEYVQGLQARARKAGVGDRLHLLPYVPVEQIVSYLRSATVGVIPLHHWPNHEISLPTKFFEFSHAHLPIVTSDTMAMAEMVRSTGQGEVFTAESTDEYVAAVRKVLDGLDHYRGAYDDQERLASWTWEKQAVVLEEVYASLLNEG